MIPDVSKVLEQVLDYAYDNSKMLNSAMPRDEFDNVKSGLAQFISSQAMNLLNTTATEDFETDSIGRGALKEMNIEDEPSLTEELFDVNQDLAAALGACFCWGKDTNCNACRGEGTPGWNYPDKESFKYYVQPALKILRKQRGR